MTKLPSDKKIIDVKWVSMLKHNNDGKIKNHEVRLLAKGYLQMKVFPLGPTPIITTI